MGSKHKEREEPAGRAPEPVTARWSEMVLICQECSDKVRSRGVDGDGTSLRNWLKRRLREDGRRKDFEVVETSCMDICPKRAITIARSSELGKGSGLRVFEIGDNPESIVRWLYG